MRRFAHVAGTALLAGATAGCGVYHSVADRGAPARLTAAVLSTGDLPAGYLPADDQPVFQGVTTSDPECQALLDLADLHGVGDAPRTSSVFYRVRPGATLAEHVVELAPARAQAYVDSAEKAAAGCPVLRTRGLKLARSSLNLRPFPELGARSYGVEYAGEAFGSGVRYSIVLAALGNRLLVVARPSLLDESHISKTDRTDRAERIAASAARKLG